MKPRLSWKMQSTVLWDSPCSSESCSKAMGGTWARRAGAPSSRVSAAAEKDVGSMSTSVRAPEQLAELPRGHRRREEETLHLFAHHLVEQVELLLGLDALGHHPQP